MPRCAFCDHDMPPGLARCPACGAEQPGEAAGPAGEDLESELRDLLAQGRKIEATSRHREATGASLAEAKQAVEAIEAGRRLERLPTGGPDHSYFELQLVELLRQGQKIEAIKAFRERTGLGLKESKEAVEEIARKHAIPPKGPGCAGWAVLLLALAFAAGVAVAVFALR